jgi:hypothetical protein
MKVAFGNKTYEGGPTAREFALTVCREAFDVGLDEYRPSAWPPLNTVCYTEMPGHLAFLFCMESQSDKEVVLPESALPEFFVRTYVYMCSNHVTAEGAMRHVGEQMSYLSISDWEDDVLPEYDYLIPEILKNWVDEETGELVLIDEEDYRDTFCSNLGPYGAFDEEFLAQYGI